MTLLSLSSSIAGNSKPDVDRKTSNVVVYSASLMHVCMYGGCSAVRHRQLLTVFALSMRYEAADVSLAVSCGILPRLIHLRDVALLTRRSSSLTQLNDISCVLATASMHLLQILAITSR